MSLLAGGGTYAASRGIKDVSKLLGGNNKQDSNELKINIPNERMPKTAGIEGALNEYLIPAGVAGAGTLGGFHLASSLYEKLKKKQIQKELETSEQDYLQNLMKVRDKVASTSTPHVDAFVQGFFEKCGEELEKLGFLDIFKKPEVVGKEGLFDVATGQAMNLADSLSDTTAGKLMIAAMMAAGAGTAGMTYSTAKKIDGRKDKDESNGGFPNEVRLGFTSSRHG